MLYSPAAKASSLTCFPFTESESNEAVLFVVNDPTALKSSTSVIPVHGFLPARTSSELVIVKRTYVAVTGAKLYVYGVTRPCACPTVSCASTLVQSSPFSETSMIVDPGLGNLAE